MSDSAAAAESPVTPQGMDAAIQVLRDANAADPVAPSETPTEQTPTAPAPAPTPTPEPTADEVAELIGKLEARKAERAAKQQPDTTALLQSKIDALEARLAQLQPPTHTQDFAALVREHGEIRALEIVGIDPLQHFARFKELAKDPAALARAKEQLAAEARLKQIAESNEKLGKTLEQLQADRAAEAERAQWNTYLAMTQEAAFGVPLLGKLPVEERVRRTKDKIAWLQQNNYPVDEINDGQLAKLVERDLRSLKDLLSGIEAPATQTTPVPANDGARPAATPTLSNDLASQGTGQTRPLSEDERVKAAVAELRRART